MRFVCDTNVVISGLLWSGSPARLIAKARSGDVQLITSEPLRAELERVLRRPTFVARMDSARTSPSELVASYAELAAIVEPGPLNAISRDRDDDVVIATAISGRADAIVSGDDDLLSLIRVRSIRIMTARDALSWLDER